jgi:hypothetical protein
MKISKQMNEEKGFIGQYFINGAAKSPIDTAEETIIIVTIIAVITFIFGFATTNIFTSSQMYIVRPLLASISVFIMFSYVLWIRARVYLFGEIGFIYLALALAYTISPAIKTLLLDFNFTPNFDRLNFAVLSPQPEELGAHLWRHVTFISGVAIGYLTVRKRRLSILPMNETPSRKYWQVIAIMMIIMVTCIFVLSSLLPSATKYIEHYTRFENLSWRERKIVDLCTIFKNGGYFVLLALMFSRYRKFRIFIFIIVPIFCVYEIVFSYGSRIVAFTLSIAVLGFYHFRVSPISLKKSMILLIAIAMIFSGIGLIRNFGYDIEEARYKLIKQNEIRASEFEAVYCTSFHLYHERGKGTLPSKDWQMFINDIIAIIPFVDHIKYNPQFWYARNYFPKESVPPTTMGVIANSAIWGGEWDLLARAMINGALFALLTHWFLRRREKWWALTIYIYCYATCIMTLKYSVLFQLAPLIRVILPSLLLAEILFRLQRTSALFKIQNNL